MANKDKMAGLSRLPAKPVVDADAFVNGSHQVTPQVQPQAPAEPPKGGASLEPTPIEAEEPTQRLTLEIPLSLHVLIKSGCAQRRTKMKEEVLALLEQHYRPTA